MELLNVKYLLNKNVRVLGDSNPKFCTPTVTG